MLRPEFCGVNPSPQLGFLRRFFLANHLASTDNLTRTTKRQKMYKRKLYNATQKAALINIKTHSETYTKREDGRSLV